MSDLGFHPAVLAGFGAAVGFLGTLVGVGGGFFMVPYFSFVGGFSSLRAVGTSLGAIVLNATSGSTRWAIQRRIDWPLGIGFALATLPGTWLGREAGRRIDSSAFQIGFAIVVAAAAASILLVAPSEGNASRLAWFRRGLRRDFVDAFGTRHTYEVNFLFGLAVSLAVGFLAALFGVGGGFLHVPVMVVLYGMPVHVAVATSQLALAVTAAGGAAGYALLSPPEVDWRTVLWVGGGAALGAQAGAFAAPRMAASGLKRILAVVLFGVAAAMAADGAGWVSLNAGR
jgi:hypothetical protein